MHFLIRYLSKCWPISVPLSLLVIINCWTLILGFQVPAVLSGWGPPGLIVFGALAYAVLWDPLKKWPNTTPLERLINIFSFKR